MTLETGSLPSEPVGSVPCVFPGRRHHQRRRDVSRCHPCTCHDLPEDQQQVLTWEFLQGSTALVLALLRFGIAGM